MNIHKHSMKSFPSARIIFIFTFLFFMIPFPADVTTATVRDGVFHEYANTGLQMLTFNQTFVEKSIIACGAACLLIHRQCFSYIYDVKTKLCTPGAYVHTTVPETPIDGVMYTSSAIDVDLDVFNVYFKEDIIVYLHISKDTLDYQDARDMCQKLGGHLYTAREEAKYNLLVDLIDGVYSGMWIGLDDLVEEGVYRWVDDKSILTAEMGDVIWGRNQPDNHDDKQHCCFWWSFYKDVADYQCERKSNYACEYSVPYRH